MDLSTLMRQKLRWIATDPPGKSMLHHTSRPCYAALIFGLSQTNGYHGQALMQGPEDEGWCERVAGGQAQ